jgi:hypothetical protein
MRFWLKITDVGWVEALETQHTHLSTHSHLARVARSTNSSTLGYPRGAPLHVNCVRFILEQDVSTLINLEIQHIHQSIVKSWVSRASTQPTSHTPK